jgi:hypothetical protein
MFSNRSWRRVSFVAALTAVSVVAPLSADDRKVFDYTFDTPVFGIATGLDGSLLVADAGAGIVKLKRGRGELVAPLPGVTDVAPTPFGMFAITGGTGPDQPQTLTSSRLFWVSHTGDARELADLAEFEATVNPDAPEVNPNPFDVAALPWPFGSVLVADAGGNTLLIVDRNGNIDWIATLPSELVSTANVKRLLNCAPSQTMPPPCALPEMIPAQAVATSIAIGPDGAYYMGELKGFPAPVGESRIWRIKPTARHARCGTSPDCTVVADGFTSIIDLTFGRDGTLHVVELDEASWFAVEVTHTPTTGTVNACKWRSSTRSFKCKPEAKGLLMPMAATVDFRGRVNVVTKALIPGEAEVIRLRRR